MHTDRMKYKCRAIKSNLDGAQAIVSIQLFDGFREIWMEGKAVGNE